MLITIGEAVAYVVSGMYGDVRELGAGNAILIILQVLQRCLLSLTPFLSAAEKFCTSQSFQALQDSQLQHLHADHMPKHWMCITLCTILMAAIHT